MSQARPDAVVVLAAGKGTRMRSALPKVLHAIGGRTLLGHVLAAAEPLKAERTLVVVGHEAERVAAHLADVAPYARPVTQTEQLGTGHAVRVALEVLADGVTGTVVVLNGDVPLMSTETLTAFVDDHVGNARAATVLSGDVPNPTGLGRIVRDPGGAVTAIVEEKDCDDAQRRITEFNAGIYAFDGALLGEALSRVSTENAQGEEYLTDVIGILVDDGRPVGAYTAADVTETLGCNDRYELATLGRLLNDRLLGDLLRSGVTMVDPATVWVDVTATVEPDATLLPGVQLHGTTVVAAGATVGPDSTLTDTVVEAGATVIRTHALGARVGAGATVGPFAYLRPATDLGEGGKIGTFVETKNATIGAGSKVPHLSYVGDATIGEKTNIGAASVFVNYDGVHKHHTTIGSHCRTGSDNMFVAPVTVGDGAYTGAGTVVRRDVPPGALAVSGGGQRNLEGWVESRRPGTPAADAAARARATDDTSQQH
ncbi:MAG TPA: bifunctional UDP-N-acetylglucosamine diphosphorylase/glucosamine-1-phosphate N-acetyltransferase GlmU [Mycobacteriales bacterium]|nr:bifunctional UDP-N-acetylglucosamine diphosphorylase/glucosamine-1-phosphate N-acetyltransferase GlmU [Mycobacteriales bacterium]